MITVTAINAITIADIGYSNKYGMASIPLGESAYNHDNIGLPEVELINLYIEDDGSGEDEDQSAKLHLQRPGLSHYADTAGATRAMYQCDGVQGGAVYVAAAGELQSITAGAATSIGAIGNDGKSAAFAASFAALGLVSGGLLYLLNAGVLTNVAIPDADTTPTIRAAIDITALANYLIIANPDGRWFYIPPGESDLISGTNALNFYTAESAADGLVACRTLGDECYFSQHRTNGSVRSQPGSTAYASGPAG